MLRRTLVRATIKKRQSKGISPMQTDGKMEHSFEKILSQVEEAQRFKPNKSHYDKAPSKRVEERLEELGTQAEAGKRPDGIMGGVNQQAQFEKVFNPASLRTSSADPEYHVYHSRPTLAQAKHASVMFRMKAFAAFVVFVLLEDQAYRWYRRRVAATEAARAAESAAIVAAAPSVAETTPVAVTAESTAIEEMLHRQTPRRREATPF